MSTSTTTNTKQWGAFLVRTLTTGVVVCGAAFVGVKLASADPGGPASPDAMTFAGVLRGTTRSTILTFVFRKGTTEVCRSATMPFTPDSSGAFSVRVPMDPARCPRSLFDGSTVIYDVLLDGETTPIATGVEITPIPYARFADQAGVNNECPAGYTFDSETSTTTVKVCARTIAGGRDEVVKVGTGASAFWIDRYEATVFDRDGTRSETYVSLNENGQWATIMERDSLLAVSRSGFNPSTQINWFQAATLCNASGKRLMTRREWFAASDGLADTDRVHPENNGDTPGERHCNTIGTRPRQTGLGTLCVSSWGVQDMIGNIWEWTDEWYSSIGQVTSGPQTVPGTAVTGIRVNALLHSWPSSYGDGFDATWNITSTVYNNHTEGVVGVPAAALRGGNWTYGSGAGVFALMLNYGPSTQSNDIGFRCVIPR